MRHALWDELMIQRWKCAICGQDLLQGQWENDKNLISLCNRAGEQIVSVIRGGMSYHVGRQLGTLVTGSHDYTDSKSPLL